MVTLPSHQGAIHTGPCPDSRHCSRLAGKQSSQTSGRSARVLKRHICRFYVIAWTDLSVLLLSSVSPHAGEMCLHSPTLARQSVAMRLARSVWYELCTTSGAVESER